jgi:hypothetical protein
MPRARSATALRARNTHAVEVDELIDRRIAGVKAPLTTCWLMNRDIGP